MKKLVFSTLILAAGFASCEKDDDATSTTPTTPAPTPICRITIADAFTGSDTARNSITYDEQGRMTNVSADGKTTHITYSGSTVYVSRPNGYDTLMLNSSGLVTQKRSRETSSGSSYQYRTDYTYNGTEVQWSAAVLTYSGYVLDSTVTTYTWSNGNRVGENVDGNPISYEFFTDKAAPATGGDYFSFGEFLATGVPIVRNKNLTKRVRYMSGGAFDLSYDFDADGKVTRASLLNGSSSGLGYLFNYTCK